MSLTVLLSTASGTFVYHLLVLMALEAMVSIALAEWRHSRNPNHRRIAWAFGGLLVMRALLLLSEPSGPPIVAPISNGIEMASLMTLGWVFLRPFTNQRSGSKYLIGGFGAISLCVIAFLPEWDHVLAQTPDRPYTALWQQTFWYGGDMLLTLASALLPLRFSQYERQSLPMIGFGLLFLGFTILCVASLLLTVGWFGTSVLNLIGVGRLISLIGYPFFTVATYRASMQWRHYREPQEMSRDASRRTQGQLPLTEAGWATGEPLDLDAALRRMAESTAKALAADRCAIFMTDSRSPETINLVAQYAPHQRSEQPTMPLSLTLAGQPILAYVLKEPQQVIINAEADNPHLQTLYQCLGAQEAGPTIVQPLLRRGRALGAMIVGNDHNQRTFGSNQGRWCRSIAMQIATAVENARLHSDLQAQTRQLARSLESQKEETHRRAAILENITEGIIISDQKGYIIIINATAESILGLPRQHILGQPLEYLMDRIPWVPKADWSTIARSNTQLETVLELEDKVIHISAVPILTQADKYLGTVAVLSDITRETKADRAKSEFITVVSHELRTPLTAIRGYAEALGSGMAGSMSETQSHFLKVIRDNALLMGSLTENLIAASQLEKGLFKLEYGEIDLRMLINDVIHSFQNQLEACQLEVSLQFDDGLPLIEADPARMRQILDNLVSNAIKFTYPGGHITIGARPLSESKGQPPTYCSLWVSDTGIGIPPEEQPRIWERFYHPTDRLTAEPSGLGVGLSIVKSLAEAHGGRVWVESTPGVGSTFTVLIPIKHANPIGDQRL